MGSSNSGTGRMFYPVNSGKKDTDVTSDYDDRINEFSNGDAFSSVSVNPQFKTTQLQYENSTTTDSWVNSANFIEIRNTSHSGAISNDDASGIVNRIYPTGTSLTTYGKNGDETNSFKIKVFDSEEDDAPNNKKFRYTVENNTIRLDIDNYDYFILINPELTTAGATRIRPHFAKITKITAFDEFGDGVEFEPKYPTSVPSQANFEIYKGAAKTDTSVVAVSYGLRGDTDVASSKYDVVQRATRPTFYFYNDRLDEDDQLDYCEKYNATSQRWWDYSDELTVDTQSAHTQYANTTIQSIRLTPTSDRDKLVEGQSVFDADDNYIGNIKEKTTTTGQFKIDYSRITLPAYQATSTAVTALGTHSQSATPDNCISGVNYTDANGGAVVNVTLASIGVGNLQSVQSITLVSGGSGYSTSSNLSITLSGGNTPILTIPVTAIGTGTSKKIKIGKTIQNVVFRTRAKFSDTIPSLGQSKINAVLVDANRTLDDNTSNSSFDATKWDTAFTRMKRHTSDLLTPTANTIDGNLTGPSKYITFEKAEYKNSKVEPMQNKSLNSPKNKLTKLARISVSDNSGLQHMKIREGDSLKLRNVIHNGKFNKMPIVGKLNTNSGSTLTLIEMTTEMNLKHMLSANDIVEVDGYYLVIDSVGVKGSDTEQSIVIKDYKTLSANTWTGSATAPTIIGKTMYLMPYSGVLNYNFESDSEVKITSAGVFQTVTMGGVAIKKEDSKMYGATLTPLRYNSHMIEVDYADKNNKFAKFKESDIQFYQKTAISPFYYYTGDYSITDEVFSGSVEDIDVSTSNGFTTFKFSGRDDTSKLLGGTVSKTLTHHSDVISTTLPPILNPLEITNVNTHVSSGNTLTITLDTGDTDSSIPSAQAFAKYTLVFNGNKELIGEVNSFTIDGTLNPVITTITVTLTHQNRGVGSSSPNKIYIYNPYSSTTTNYITGTKSLQSNILHTQGISDFVSISERGLSFKSGLDVSYSDNEFTHTPLQLSSNSQTFGDTLGYDISSPKSISTNDAVFAFTIGNENGVSVTKTDIMSVNSEMFDVVNVNKQDYTTPVLEIAPIFPMVLGRIDSNNQDVRGNTNLYLVNNNIATGGFIHRLPNSLVAGGVISSTEIIRYWDLQNISSGGLTKSHDSIYNVGTKPQSIQGYAVGYSVGGAGDAPLSGSPTSTVTNKPLAGSNTLKDWNYRSTFYGNHDLITSYAANSNNDGVETDIMFSQFEQIDPRTTPYELLAIGDIYPSSAQRHNSMFNSNNAMNFENYGIILEGSSGKTNNTKHEKYDGMSHQTLKRESSFESQNIISSNKTTENIRRWGVIRLVEATFDWHFNPINFETLQHASKIPSLKYFDYVMMSKPSTLTNKTLANSSGAASGTLLSEMNLGDVVYDTAKIGTNNTEQQENFINAPDVGNGFIAVKQTNSSGNVEVNSNAIYSENHSITGGTNSLLNFEGDTHIHGIEAFRLFHAPDLTLDNLESNTDNNFQTARDFGRKKIRFHTCWLAHPPINTGVFSHQLLARWSTSSEPVDSSKYDPMNIILPLIVENKGSGGTAYQYEKGPHGTGYNVGLVNSHTTSTHKRDWRFSPYHQIDGWNDDGIVGINTDNGISRLHMSRVISAMVTSSFKQTGIGITHADEESLGVGRTHVYDNCIGIFKDVEQSSVSDSAYLWPEKVSLTSSPLGFMNYGHALSTSGTYKSSDSSYASYSSNYTDLAGKLIEQHSPVARVFDWTNESVADGDNFAEGRYKATLLGTKSIVYPFDSIGVGKSQIHRDAIRDANHVGDVVNNLGQSLSNLGMMYSSQLIIKPTFDLTEDTGTLELTQHTTITPNSTSIYFTLDDDSKHTWLSFMPDLTGYYLVSEKYVDGNTLANSTHHGVPVYIGKITAHDIITAPSTSAYEKHRLTLDTTINTTTQGVKFRLMRISETTFDKTPDKIEFNVMHDTGLEYKTTSTNYRNGDGNSESGHADKRFQEAVYSMYLKLDMDSTIESTSPYIESRTTTSALRGFDEDEEVIDVYVTDGLNSKRKTVTVGRTRKKKSSDATEPCLVLSFDGSLTGNGVVSFGEVFDVSVNRNTRLGKIKRCYIGTTYDIGSDIDDELSNIIMESGLKYDERKTTVVYTTNIVDTNGTNNIVCLEKVTGLNDGDVIYSEDGHLIGEILSITNQTITFAAGTKYYSPPQYSTITKYNKKTFVSNLTFNSFNVFSAINSLTQKKGLDYRIEDNKVILRNLEDTSSIKRKKIDFEHLTGHEPIKNNTSLFDKINRIIVIGDGVRYEMDSLDVKNMKTMTVNDSTITTEEEAQVTAMKLLELHSGKARKIKLQIKREGFELLEAGDIVTLDFPTYNIPSGNYIVFDIENVLGPILILTVGSYSKGIAERLNEISQGSKQNINHLLSANSSGTVGGKMIFDNLKIKIDSIEYKVEGEVLNANMGFDDVFGFTETVGFETTSTGVSAIKKEYKDRFYD